MINVLKESRRRVINKVIHVCSDCCAVNHNFFSKVILAAVMQEKLSLRRIFFDYLSHLSGLSPFLSCNSVKE